MAAVATQPSSQAQEQMSGQTSSHNDLEHYFLNEQHAIFKGEMGGQLVLAPVEFEKGGLRVLDSGTADGYWLYDLSKDIARPETHTYVGTDITDRRFPPGAPPNTTLILQSITDSWPGEWKSSFDLVHQRLCLAGCRTFPVDQAVRNLGELVKPGGWIQFVEPEQQIYPSDGPSMRRFVGMIQEVLKCTGMTTTYATTLKQTLEDAGFESVQERLYQLPMGAANKSAELGAMGARSTRVVSGHFAHLVKTLPASMRTSLTDDELDAIPADLERELVQHGGHNPFRVVWGRRPLTYLQYRYRAHHVDDPKIQLPSEDFVWPDGQGNVGKFIHGKENSSSWGKKHGSIYRIWSGTSAEVVLTEPSHIRAVFFDSNKHIKAVDNNSGYVLGTLLGDCLGLISQGRWQQVRTAFEPPFTHTATFEYVSLVCKETWRHFEDVVAPQVSCSGRDGDSGSDKRDSHDDNKLRCQLDPVADFKILPFRIVTRILYGELPAALLADLDMLIPLHERLFRTAISGGLTRFRWAAWLPLASSVRRAHAELHDFVRRWEAFNDAAVANASKNVHTGTASRNGYDGSDGMSLGPAHRAPILDLYQQMRQGRLTKSELLQTLDEILFANLDVTIGGISWACFFLAADKAAQRRLWEETQEQQQRQQERQQHRPGCQTVKAAYLQSKTTSYLHACVLEAARLRPLAAFSVPQAAPTARQLAGYRIPAGTDFIVDTHALNIRNSFWSAAAGDGSASIGGGDSETNPAPCSSSPSSGETFIPDRWLEKSSTNTRYHYWRFGFGPRQCLGKYVADLIIHALLVELVSRYDVSMPFREGSGDEDKWKRDMDTWIMHPDIKLECRPR